jgi:hypothetical protein
MRRIVSSISAFRPGAKPITVLFHVAGASLSATVYAAMSPSRLLLSSYDMILISSGYRRNDAPNGLMHRKGWP